MARVVDRAIAGSVRYLPRPIVRRLSRRYIAGDRVDEAVAAVSRLASLGCRATVDVLGEHVTSREQALATRAAYTALLDRLDERGLPSGVSVKATAMGLALDHGFCLENLRAVATAAASRGRFMRVDMEESAWTSSTLDLVQNLHRDHPNVGAVIQARLHRSPADIKPLMARRISVRLCKGIYLEPASIAHQGFHEIRAAYLGLLDSLLGAGCFVGVATHDRGLVDRGLELLARHGLRPDGFEFQMLMGVAEPLRTRLVAAGHRVRVYVPYGSDWFAYSVRRLQENPKMATAIAKGLLGR